MTGIAAAVEQWFAAHREEVIGWRRHIHSHPELSHMEYETTAFVEKQLLRYGLSPVRFPGTGLMADIGPATEQLLGFRADIDALPITETAPVKYSSQVPGVSHMCGHDVHTAIVLGLACALAENAHLLEHGVRVIFQPAEEVMDGGAPDVIAFGGLDKVAALYAVHVEPKLKVGKIGMRTGPITSAADVLKINVYGSGGHSSRPHLTADVVYALSKLVTDLPGLLSRRVDPRTSTVLVFGSINAGYAPNAIPESGSISGTVRTADLGTWRSFQGLLEELIAQVLAPTGCTHEVIYQRGVPPVVNDDVATALLADAARVIDPQAVVAAPQSAGGEDFSWYLEHVPGSMARLGSASSEQHLHDLHQGDLVIDERAIEVGIKLFGSTVEQYSIPGGYLS